jgi:hypothetical protein
VVPNLLLEFLGERFRFTLSDKLLLHRHLVQNILRLREVALKSLVLGLSKEEIKLEVLRTVVEGGRST